MMHKSNWDDLRFVLAVAEAGSVNAATRQLGVNHATVLRRVGAFETKHGLHIFTRNASGYAVDPACLPVIAAIRKVSEAVEGCERVMARGDLQVSGPLRLTTTDTLANCLLPRILPEFRRRFPGIRLQVEVTNDRLNLSRLDAELTIRPARALPEDLSGERVCSMGFAAYGRADYVAGLSDMAEADWIGIAGALEKSPTGAWEAGLNPERIVCAANSFPAMAALVTQGLGLAMLPCCMSVDLPDLIRVPVATEHLETGLWIGNHPDLDDVPRIAETRAILAALIRARSDILLAGR